MPSYCWTFDTNMSEGEVDRRTHSVTSGLALMRVEGFVIGAIGECQVGRLGDPFSRAETEQFSALLLGTTLLGGGKTPHYTQDHMQQQQHQTCQFKDEAFFFLLSPHPVTL